MDHIGWRRATRCLGTFVLLVSGCVDGAKPAAEVRQIGQMETVPEAEAPAISVAANDARTRAPLDATPSPDGKRVYYLATTLDEQGEEFAGVFVVAADGGKGAQPETVSSGEPLVTPVGITTSLDGNTLFVADTAASSVFSVQSAGGSLSALSGTEGYQPAGVTVARRQKEERVFFTGHDPQSGAAGLFSLPASGGAAQVEASGDLFEHPGGVVVSAKGDAFVVDMGQDNARVLRVRDGKAEAFVSGIGVGFPAGITLTHDESTLIVSGLDPNTKHDVVYFVEVASGKLSQLTQVVGAFSEAAGLHRAHDTDVFAWADSRANASGTVYLLKL
jgi:sugar lactone lactonase YvrE